LRRNPSLVFAYISGQSTDSSEKGGAMWARVKGKTENTLLALSDKAVMFRPGFIQPLHGIRSRTAMYRFLYMVMTPLMPLVKLLAKDNMTTTEKLGRAMLQAARGKAQKRVLEVADINALAG
jgi:hypothetical protein